MSIDADNLKQTMRCWVSGVTVVTTAHQGRRAGITASSFTSISVEPPLILFSIQHYTDTFKLIEQSGSFAVCILREDQANLSAQFAGFAQLPEGADKFYNVNLTTAVTGVPILVDCLAWLDCRLEAIYEAAVSRIVVGEVVATGQNLDARYPLAYHNRGYFNLVPQTPP
jgi:flavin reductase (DIM6/NTAB) family NADH-FMN oxidoreductase RutF